jgi:hypothetical protein
VGTWQVTLVKQMQQSRKLATEQPAQMPLPDIPEVTQPQRSHSEPCTDTKLLANMLQLDMQGTNSPLDCPMPITGEDEFPSFQSSVTSSTPHGCGKSLIQLKPAWKVSDTLHDVETKVIKSDVTKAQGPTPCLSGTELVGDRSMFQALPAGRLTPVVSIPAPRQT